MSDRYEAISILITSIEQWFKIEKRQKAIAARAGVGKTTIYRRYSGIMLYALIFQPTTESWEAYVCRALHLLLKETLIQSKHRK